VSEHAWWNRPVWPTRTAFTPAERRAQVRGGARAVGRALVSTPGLVAIGAVSLVALATAALTAGVDRFHPAYLWLAASVVLAADAALLTRRAGRRRRPHSSLPDRAAPAVGLVLAAALVGVPWALAGQTSGGTAHALGAALPVSTTDAAVQLGDRVAFQTPDDDTVTMLDLTTGTWTTTNLGSPVQWLSVAGDDLLATTADGVTLLDRDGNELWHRAGGGGFMGQLAVAASDGVVVLADRAAPDDGPPSAVAVRRDGTVAWHRQDVTAEFAPAFTAGGVLEYGAALPTVTVLAAHGGAVVVDPITGEELGSSTSKPVAALGDLVLWQDPATDGACDTVATRADRTVWRATVPCVSSVMQARGAGVEYVHFDTATATPLHVFLDASTGAATVLRSDSSWSVLADGEVRVRVELTSENDATARLVGADASGRQRWSLPAEPWPAVGMWVQSAEGTVVATTAPLTVDPLARLRTPGQVTVVDPRTGAVTGWVRCRTAALSQVPLDDGRALALCQEPGGSVRAWLVG
jgi:hypothetical protein